MTRWLPALSSSLLLLAAAAAAGEAELVVPAGSVPRIDGKIGEEEWQDAAAFEVRRGEEVVGRARIKLAGRQLYLSYETALDAWALGVRFNFVDPVSKRSNPVLVTPLHPPAPPIAAYRQLARRSAQNVSCTSSDLRLDLKKGVAFELRLPMDLIEFARSAKVYRFSVECWNLAASKTLGVFPAKAAGVSGGLGSVALRPAVSWGAEVALDAPAPPRNDAIALLEELRGAGAEEGAAYRADAGWVDGKRKDAPLAALEQRIVKALDRYPGYVGLHATLVQCRVARGDLEGALAALDALGTAFPEMGASPRHLLIRMELLRDLGRFDEALAVAESNPEFLRGDPRARDDHTLLESLRDAWRAELAVRAEEARRDDLPRVRLKTNRGEILIELFEDDAPNAVASFLSLVEAGAYDGTRFHWVEGGRRAIGGDPNSKDDDPHNDGYGDPGYLIESEPSRRLNLPYTVGLADKRRTRHTEGATFVLHIAPLPAVDGRNTVFGRVLKGRDVVRRLEYYDTLEKAEVLRKRNHPYTPTRRK